MYAGASMKRAGVEEHRKRPYLQVFGLLAVLTLIELQIPNLPAPRTDIMFVLIAIATAKASLVVMYYMHLRYEPRLLALIPISTVLLVLILAFFLAYR
jgi:cytochrome c oxidase subunit 4